MSRCACINALFRGKNRKEKRRYLGIVNQVFSKVTFIHSSDFLDKIQKLYTVLKQEALEPQTQGFRPSHFLRKSSGDEVASITEKYCATTTNQHLSWT